MNQNSFYQTINEVITLYREPPFLYMEGIRTLCLLKKLKHLKENYGQNHPSMPSLLHHVGNILDDIGLSRFAILFYLEQLRIENHYLGFEHPDLATLYKIGEFYVKNDRFSEATEYFIQAFTILKNKKIEKRLYALTIYKLGLVSYHQSLYDDAFKIFNFALKQLCAAAGEFHPDVAEMHKNVADLQVEVGKLEDAMDNYLKALMILRIVYGNTHLKVLEVLRQIGLVHKAKGEHDASLNSFYHMLDVMRKIQDKDESIVRIMYEICLIYQLKGDTDNTLRTFEEIVKVLKLKLGEKHAYLVHVLGLLRNLYIEYGLVERSNNAAKEIQDVTVKSSKKPLWNNDDEFECTLIRIFGHATDYSIQAAAAA